MGHDQLFIAKRLKSYKQVLDDDDQEVFYEMAIDMEFPCTAEADEQNKESC